MNKPAYSLRLKIFLTGDDAKKELSRTLSGFEKSVDTASKKTTSFNRALREAAFPGSFSALPGTVAAP